MKITDETPFDLLLQNENFQKALYTFLPYPERCYPTIRKMTVKEFFLNYWKVGEEGDRYFTPMMQDMLDRCSQKGFVYQYDETRYGSVILNYSVPNPKGTFLVSPGGGYASVCGYAEAFLPAKRLNEMGYSALIVGYGIEEDARYPLAIDDYGKAVAFAIKNHLIGKDYAVMGFSAAGHLVGLFGTEKYGYVHYGLPKPKIVVLSYPVISFTLPTHGDSRKYFLGEDRVNDEKMRQEFSLENRVTSAYPPTFLWRANEDPCVPTVNEDAFEKALAKENIPHEYHIYPGNGHGWGDGTNTPSEGWMKTMIAFYQKH
jgi:acetyl esterase/lipase